MANEDETSMSDGMRREPPVLGTPLGGLLILVVEDNDDSRTLLSTVLTMCGADTLTAASAAEAIAVLERASPDLLISDINMPGEDGIALLGRIRDWGDDRVRQMPAIALTALDGAADRERILAAGYQVYLAKPVDIEQLLVSIARLRASS